MSADDHYPNISKGIAPGADNSGNTPAKGTSIITPAPWPPAQLVSDPPPTVLPPPAPPPPQTKSSGSLSEIRLPNTSQSSADTAKPYRPSRRPPVPQLHVLDDGSNSGEIIRIRSGSFVIGRTEGDLTFPTDQLCSKRHVEIVYEKNSAGGGQWVVVDLQSLHGTFFRHRRAPMMDGTEILVGGGCYRLEAGPDSLRKAETDISEIAGSTLGRLPVNPICPPVLREVTIDRESAEFIMTDDEIWIGTDESCQIRRTNDPFTSPRHVRLFRDSRGIWQAENNKTANGLWIKLPRLVIRGECAFQIGEQRFRILVQA